MSQQSLMQGCTRRRAVALAEPCKSSLAVPGIITPQNERLAGKAIAVDDPEEKVWGKEEAGPSCPPLVAALTSSYRAFYNDDNFHHLKF